MDRFEIATAPVNWNNFDLTNWRKPVPFPDILDEVVRAGYWSTEWDQSFGNNTDELNAAASARGLTFCGAYRWFDFLDDEKFQESLAEFLAIGPLLTSIGATNLIVADRLRDDRVALAGRAFRQPELSLTTAEFQQIAANCSTLADAAHDLGISTHYHNHVGTNIESPVEVAALLAELDPAIGLCFDTGHYAYGGGDPVAFLHDHVDRCSYFHLKDVDNAVLDESRQLEWTFQEALRHIVFPPIGEGYVDFAAVSDVIVSSNFIGVVVIEQDTCLGDPTVVAEANRAFIERSLSSALERRRA